MVTAFAAWHRVGRPARAPWYHRAMVPTGPGSDDEVRARYERHVNPTLLDEYRALPALVRDLGARLASQGQRGWRW